jgi:hypothetical protein
MFTFTAVCYLKHYWPCNMSTPTQPTSATLQMLQTQQPSQIGQMFTYKVWHFRLRISSGIKPWSTVLNSESLVNITHRRNVAVRHSAYSGSWTWDVCSRLELCRWINSNHHMVRNILFNDEAHFIRDGVHNTRNSRLWDSDNPRATVESNYQHLLP